MFGVINVIANIHFLNKPKGTPGAYQTLCSIVVNVAISKTGIASILLYYFAHLHKVLFYLELLFCSACQWRLFCHSSSWRTTKSLDANIWAAVSIHLKSWKMPKQMKDIPLHGSFSFKNCCYLYLRSVDGTVQLDFAIPSTPNSLQMDSVQIFILYLPSFYLPSP